VCLAAPREKAKLMVAFGDAGENQCVKLGAGQAASVAAITTPACPHGDCAADPWFEARVYFRVLNAISGFGGNAGALISEADLCFRPNPG